MRKCGKDSNMVEKELGDGVFEVFSLFLLDFCLLVCWFVVIVIVCRMG